MSKSQDKNNDLHAGHRERLTDKYLTYGIDALSDHEALELVLFYAIPRKDTNELAHILINELGSLEAVISASVDRLVQIDGIGKRTATLLSLFFSVPRVISLSKNKNVKHFKKLADIESYLINLYTNLTHERIYMLLLDNSMRLIDCINISDGSVNSAQIDYRRLATIALEKKASGVILSHNHPDGLAIPSSNDINTTQNMDSVLSTVGVTLIEHIVVGADRCSPIMLSRFGYNRGSTSLQSSIFTEDFFKNFYTEEL